MADSARFSQSHGIVPICASTTGDYNAGLTMESINMAKYNHCTIIMYGDSAVAGNGVLTIYGGATDAAQTAAITFTYRYSAANELLTNSDVLGDPATSAALTITGTSFDLRLLVIEIDAEDLNVSGIQYQFITPVLSAAGTAGYFTAIAILSEPRFAKAVMPSAVA